MPNWNAYKVFANGKRAKSPYTTFEADEPAYFTESILPSLAKKLQKAKWLIVNVEEAQERHEEAIDEEANLYLKNRSMILGKIASIKFPELGKKKMEACLMMSEHTGWKWAWCLAEAASHKYIGELSDRFENDKLADAWVKEQIECMAST
tara:strand:+ start:452 stop:901 length:450 start_codon:yes stop_codon:yes gene_type:complete